MRKRPPKPKRTDTSKKPTSPIYRGKSVFSVDAESEEEIYRKDVLESIEISTSETDNTPEMYARATTLEPETILASWEGYTKTITPKMLDIVVRSYALMESLHLIQSTLREDSIDPNSEIITTSLSKNIEMIIEQRLCAEIVSYLYDDAEEAKAMIAELIRPIGFRAPSKGDHPLKKLIEQVNKNADAPRSSPYGDIGAASFYGDKE